MKEIKLVDFVIKPTQEVPEWVVRMNEFYCKTGGYRYEDIVRCLGDQSQRVEIGGELLFRNFLNAK